MTEDDLKPCPFCGRMYPRIVRAFGSLRVECGNLRCIAYGPSRETKQGAINAWNRRDEA